MTKLLTYLRDTRGELRHVSWPTQRQTMLYTLIVIVVSVVTAMYLAGLDLGFTRGLNVLLRTL